MPTKISVTTAIALTMALAAPATALAQAMHLPTSPYQASPSAMAGSAHRAVIREKPERLNDCVHVQFPQCSDGDSTATRIPRY
jgi:hypothetical protein